MSGYTSKGQKEGKHDANDWNLLYDACDKNEQYKVQSVKLHLFFAVRLFIVYCLLFGTLYYLHKKTCLYLNS